MFQLDLIAPSPMKYALISDVHANLPALEAVLADIRKHPELEATYELLRTSSAPSVPAQALTGTEGPLA
jgi:hypothetical protein